ncbi:MAG: efflux RND transporter periplasmic adaptor subunit [Terracidiphilus sp.]|nr:efflux RND transporter periplasmic adaptor subunit [Terracidiphilus sp.]
MSIEGAPESNQSQINGNPENHEPKNMWVRVVVYAVVLLAVGLGVWRIYLNHQQEKANNEKQQSALVNRPVPVQAVAVEARPMPIYLTAIGTVTPYMSVTVKARVSGQLLPVHFTEGQQVRAGQTIMTIDPKPYRAALNQAKGNLAHDVALLKNAQAQAARYKALYDAGVVSKESMQAQDASFGQYTGQIEADRAAVESAQLQLNWCSVQSPISGKIGLRLVDPGNIITANTTNLVIINQFQPIAVDFTLPEDQLPQVLQKLAGSHKLPVDAYDHDQIQKLAGGQLLTADNQIDTTTGTAKLKAVFDNRDNKLYPNQFVNIRLVMENRPNALVVPSAAIQTGQQGNFVWVVDTDANGKTVAKMQLIKIALAQGQLTILDSGVQAGQKVVVDGAERLKAGSLVTVSAPRQHLQTADTATGTQQSGQNHGGSAAAQGGKDADKQQGKTHGKTGHKEQQ